MPSPSDPIEAEPHAAPSAQPEPPSLSSSETPSYPVVSNTTPLITLGEIGLLDALGQLYGTVWIPPTALAEYQRGQSAHPQRPDLDSVSWLTVHPAPSDPLVPSSLDAGEHDAIALARAVQASRILLDERDARMAAMRLNLVVTGSVGVLLAAKHVGIILHVKPYLDRMLAQGRYISPSLYEQVMRQVGE